ncbi:tRNA uridine-5-carboxymethylaminomethyl(34) synthesis GTPase MnmE [Paenalcaligenes faecalis]|uniref:tRNA uridine-5-carboxymethylaminomethyl(34) synthesis GTPase MnmE n=1 Tax=Paenalcaligenes faecalis TaxID=2980099 RepID=UPI0022B9BEA1|nr:tRNA uridine-5-carboxymethylaminomethyl(34) synthesis GTPase MnmE [Paenalcaligenes faecalis]
MSAITSYPIAAITTAPGRGGIGIVRISGPDLSGFIHSFFAQELRPRHAHFLAFLDADGQAIDEGIALYFKGPNSYTGEDILELQGHGGTAVLRRVLNRCFEVGAAFDLRHAAPGEFTQRAFLNDRLDLAQAEAVADLIDASSEAAAKGAMASLSGAFSQQINNLADKIIHLRMLVEATLDFPEEEIDFLEKYQAADQLRHIDGQLQQLRLLAKQGQVMRDGLHVVLAGQPNVGKSSLLNALAGDDIAIVTDIAGTTRDRVTQLIHIEGIPIHIVDTAGLRETDDTVESIGIQRSWQEIAKANVILHLLDGRQPDDNSDHDIMERLPKHTPTLQIFNKCDLLSADQQNALPNDNKNHLQISAQTGMGLDELRQRLLQIAGWSANAESPWLARERHLHALERCNDHLKMAQFHAKHDDQILDLFAEELRLAHNELCEITGVFTSDDLLGEIFSSFCIGK